MSTTYHFIHSRSRLVWKLGLASALFATVPFRATVASAQSGTPTTARQIQLAEPPVVPAERGRAVRDAAPLPGKILLAPPPDIQSARPRRQTRERLDSRGVLLAEPPAGPETRYLAAGKGSERTATTVPSYSPTNGSGTGANFTITVQTDQAAGANAIQGAALLFNSAPDQNSIPTSGACNVLFNRAANTLQLTGDDGSLASTIALGSNASVENSQCRVSANGSSAVANGNSITLTARVDFKTSFTGVKNVWALTTDFDPAVNATRSSYYLLTTYTVGLGVANQPPFAAGGSVPNPAVGSGGVFSITYTDPNGANDIRYVEALINTVRVGAGACYVNYNRNNGLLVLRNDAGSDWLPPITLGTSQSTSNSQCTVLASGSSASLSGNSLILSLQATFTPAFSGTKNVYAIALDQANTFTDWLTVGSYTVVNNNAPNLPPAAISAAPLNGTGNGQLFSFSYADPNGASDLYYVEALISNGLTATNACFIHYDVATNGLYVRNDNSTDWGSGITPGSSGTRSNSQCTINGLGSSVQTSGNGLVVNVNVGFLPAFASATVKDVYLVAVDNARTYTNWLRATGYTVTGSPGGNSAPYAVSVVPSSNSGSSATFTASYNDPQGAADLRYVELLINTVRVAANGCLINYNLATSTAFLRNDQSTDWLGPVQANGAGAVSNSQCTLNGFSATPSGNTLTFVPSLTFTASFAATNPGKTIYAVAVNRAGAANDWLTASSFTVTTTNTGGGGGGGGGTPNPTATSQPSALAQSTNAGTSAAFSATFTDPAGAAAIQYVEMLINTSTSGVNACYVNYRPATATFYLRDDLSQNWLPLTAGGTVQNSQCILNAAGSGASTAGTQLVVTTNLTFKDGFGGLKNIYLNAVNTLGVSSNFIPYYPSFTVQTTTGGGTVGGSAGILQSNSGAVYYGNGFGATYFPTGSVANIATADIAILPSPAVGNTFANGCLIRFDLVANTVQLRNDADTAWSVAVAAGPAGSTVALTNSKCSVDPSRTSATLSPTNLQIGYNISFTLPSSSRRVLLGITDKSNVVSPYIQVISSIFLP